MNKHILFFGILSIFFLGISCDHDTEPFDGPSLIDSFGPFRVIDSLTVDRDVINFQQGENMVARALFNKRVEYELIITGLESGAVRIIDGFDSELNEDNARWAGRTSRLPFFRAEECLVELLIPKEDSLRMSTRVTIEAPRIYDVSLYTGFEDDPGANIVTGNFEFELTGNTGRRNDGLSAEGDWYFNFEGTDDVVPNFFVGLIDIKSSITGSTYAPVPTSVPEDLYFNCFIYNDGGPHGIAVIQIIADANGNGSYEEDTDTAFPIGDVPLDFQGWRQISVNVSEIGMNETQVQEIVNIRALLISNMNSQPNPPLPVDYRLDFLCFTDGPLVL